MAVGIRADTHYVDVRSAVQEGPQEAGCVGKWSPRIGVTADAEHLSDADGVDPLDDLFDVVLTFDHAGREVGNDCEPLVGVAGT